MNSNPWYLQTVGNDKLVRGEDDRESGACHTSAWQRKDHHAVRCVPRGDETQVDLFATLITKREEAVTIYWYVAVLGDCKPA